MAKSSPRELFEAFYPGLLPPGKFGVYTITLKKGNEYSHWCHHLPQGDRVCQKFRNTRRIRFGPALQSEKQALRIAGERRPRAKSSSIRGSGASVTALPAMWAVIPYGSGAAAPDALGGGVTCASLPPGRRAALGLLEAVGQRPSIVISTRAGAPRGERGPGSGGVIYAVWLLHQPWLFDLEDPAAAERTAAGALLCRVQGAVARLAAERGWWLGDGAATDLAASLPLPGSLTGAAGGPRATLETFPLLPGECRYRRRDFESLPEPPPPDPQPWRSVMQRPSGLGRGRQTFDFGPIADGCSWIRGCRAERAGLSRKQLENAVRLLIWCAAPGAQGGELAHELYRGHTGYDPVAVDRLLARELRAPGGPITCVQIGRQPGVLERHCSSCPHFGQIEAPVELALPAARATAAASDAARDPAAPVAANLSLPVPTGRADAGAAAASAANATAAPSRIRIVVTCRRHEVNDQAMAAVAAGAELFEQRGVLVELVRYPNAAPAVRRVSEARLEELLSRHCELVTETGTAGAEPREVAPPRWTTRGILARGRWPELPQLSSVHPSTHPQPKEESRMTIDDLWDSDGPSPADLKVLERLGRHRRAFEALEPAGEHQTTVRNRLLGLLDDMEETLCEEGRAAPALAEAWQRMDELEARYWESAEADPPAPQNRASGSASRPNPTEADRPPGRGRPAPQTRASAPQTLAARSALPPDPPGPEGAAETSVAANDPISSPKAA